VEFGVRPPDIIRVEGERINDFATLRAQIAESSDMRREDR
jgi:hypothetical protein